MGKKHSQLSFVRITLQISLVWDRRKILLQGENHAKYTILHTNYEIAALIGLKSGNVAKPTSGNTVEFIPAQTFSEDRCGPNTNSPASLELSPKEWPPLNSISLVHGAKKLCRQWSQASHPQLCSALRIMTYTFYVIFIYLKIIVQTIILSSLEISEGLANVYFVPTRQELTSLIATALFGQSLGFYFSVVPRQLAASISISCQAPWLGCCCFCSVTWEFSTLATCWNELESFNFLKKEEEAGEEGGRKKKEEEESKAKGKQWAYHRLLPQNLMGRAQESVFLSSPGDSLLRGLRTTASPLDPLQKLPQGRIPADSCVPDGPSVTSLFKNHLVSLTLRQYPQKIIFKWVVWGQGLNFSRHF